MPIYYGTHNRALIVKIQQNTKKNTLSFVGIFLIIGNLSVRFGLPARTNVASETYG